MKIKCVIYVFLFTLLSCDTFQDNKSNEIAAPHWKQQFAEKLEMLGHRNWILIVDKAFPEQNAAGITYINSNEKLLPVLAYVMTEINKAPHVKPIVYQDKELNFITEEQSRGVKQFTDGLKNIVGGSQVQTILHDSVFVKIAEATKLFNVLIIKTNETIPYSSIFLQLDCAYWNNENEKMLRSRMPK